MSSESGSTATHPAKRVVSAPSRARTHVVAGRESMLREHGAAASLLSGLSQVSAQASAQALPLSPAALAHPAPAEALAPAIGDSREDVAARLERRIRAHLPRCTLAVTLTDNRYTMISVRREGTPGARHFVVRLHRMFADSSPGVTRALARYIDKNDREASRVLGDFIDAHQDNVRAGKRRSPRIRIETRGRYHDLQDIFDDLNERYFGGRIDARITWGQRTGKPRRRNSIKMGSYSVEDRLVRIHRSLDREFVPRFFVEWIVYHEMLHQVHGVAMVGGRRCFHSREFQADEARFEHYAAARIWERAHLEQLLTY